MRVKGYFKSCAERSYDKKDGTKGRSIECMFAIEGERDEIRVSTWHDVAWCKERGITTGASGELNVHMGTNDRGYYEQVIWGFKTTEQLAKEQAEREASKSAVEHAAEVEAKTEAAIAQAEANGEQTDLPF